LNNTTWIKWASALGLIAAIAACSSPVKLDDDVVLGTRKTPPIENRGDSGGPGSGGGGGDASGRSVAPVEIARPGNDPKDAMSQRSIYFEYDSYSLRDQDKAVIEAHARHLNATKGRKVVIQGNTDERGSREYNLALGQKRAEAVKRALSALGVPESQLEAVSFGEEKPKSTGTDEGAFAENRRADLAYE
jgi:peptidoglycan-associated lipoprotein